MNENLQDIADWLRDAHAMESNIVNMLEGQLARLSDFPDLQQSVQMHAEESKRHADLVEAALQSLGEDPSLLKEGMARIAGRLSPMGLAMASDAPVKIVLSNYAIEHFEIACYRSLEIAATAAGLPNVAETCREILEDEENMARLIEPAIEVVTNAHLNGIPARS
jgi:ferritin-like metal-binding protein YciE